MNEPEGIIKRPHLLVTSRHYFLSITARHPEGPRLVSGSVKRRAGAAPLCRQGRREHGEWRASPQVLRSPSADRWVSGAPSIQVHSVRYDWLRSSEWTRTDTTWMRFAYLCWGALSFHAARRLNAPALCNKMEGKPQIRSLSSSVYWYSPNTLWRKLLSVRSLWCLSEIDTSSGWVHSDPTPGLRGLDTVPLP